MASNSVTRYVRAIFDRNAASKMEREFEASLKAAGVKAGGAFLKELRAAFEQKMAGLKEKLAAGIIDKKEFAKQADAAAKAFNAVMVKSIEGARKAGTLTNQEYLKLSRQFKKTGDEGVSAWDRIKRGISVAGAALAAFVGLRALERFGRDAIKQAMEAEQAWADLAGTVRAAGDDYDALSEQLQATGKEFQRLTIYSDEDYAKSLQRLVALTGDTTASIHNMGIVANVAARFFGGDLTQATEAVAKGMNVGYVTINRVKYSLDQLTTRSLGAAAEKTNTFSGKMKILSNNWSEFKEQLGNTLVDSKGGPNAIETLTGLVQGLTRFVIDNAAAFRDWATGIISTAKTVAQTLGISLTAGAQGFKAGTNEDQLKRQLAILDKQRTQFSREKAELLRKVEDAKLFNLRNRNQGGAALEDANLDLRIASDNLADVERNATAAKLALDALTSPTKGGLDFKARPAFSKNRIDEEEKEDKEAKRQEERFRERFAELKAESEGLKRLEAAQREGTAAVEDANRALKFEEELRKELKDATADQAAQLVPLLYNMELQRRASDNAAKAADRHASQLEVIGRANAKTREADVGGRNLAASLRDQADAQERLNAAEQRGPAALLAVQRELFIANALFEAGPEKIALWGDEIVRQAGRAFDALHRLPTASEKALNMIDKQISGLGTDVMEGLFGGKDRKRRIEEVTTALKKENLTVQERIGLEQELGDLKESWLAKVAKNRVLMNLAQALELGVQSVVHSLFGDFVGASNASAGAVSALAAAAAWGAVATAAGGGGGSAPTSSAGPGSSSGNSPEPRGADVTIVFDGPDIFNPRLQKQLNATLVEVRERMGPNTKVTVRKS